MYSQSSKKILESVSNANQPSPVSQSSPTTTSKRHHHNQLSVNDIPTNEFVSVTSTKLSVPKLSDQRAIDIGAAFSKFLVAPSSEYLQNRIYKTTVEPVASDWQQPCVDITDDALGDLLLKGFGASGSANPNSRIKNFSSSSGSGGATTSFSSSKPLRRNPTRAHLTAKAPDELFLTIQAFFKLSHGDSIRAHDELAVNTGVNIAEYFLLEQGFSRSFCKMFADFRQLPSLGLFLLRMLVTEGNVLSTALAPRKLPDLEKLREEAFYSCGFDVDRAQQEDYANMQKQQQRPNSSANHKNNTNQQQQQQNSSSLSLLQQRQRIYANSLMEATEVSVQQSPTSYLSQKQQQLKDKLPVSLMDQRRKEKVLEQLRNFQLVQEEKKKMLSSTQQQQQQQSSSPTKSSTTNSHHNQPTKNLSQAAEQTKIEAEKKIKFEDTMEAEVAFDWDRAMMGRNRTQIARWSGSIAVMMATIQKYLPDQNVLNQFSQAEINQFVANAAVAEALGANNNNTINYYENIMMNNNSNTTPVRSKSGNNIGMNKKTASFSQQQQPANLLPSALVGAAALPSPSHQKQQQQQRSMSDAAGQFGSSPTKTTTSMSNAFSSQQSMSILSGFGGTSNNSSIFHATTTTTAGATDSSPSVFASSPEEQQKYFGKVHLLHQMQYESSSSACEALEQCITNLTIGNKILLPPMMRFQKRKANYTQTRRQSVSLGGTSKSKSGGGGKASYKKQQSQQQNTATASNQNTKASASSATGNTGNKNQQQQDVDISNNEHLLTFQIPDIGLEKMPRVGMHHQNLAETTTTSSGTNNKKDEKKNTSASSPTNKTGSKKNVSSSSAGHNTNKDNAMMNSNDNNTATYVPRSVSKEEVRNQFSLYDHNASSVNGNVVNIYIECSNMHAFSLKPFCQDLRSVKARARAAKFEQEMQERMNTINNNKENGKTSTSGNTKTQQQQHKSGFSTLKANRNDIAAAYHLLQKFAGISRKKSTMMSGEDDDDDDDDDKDQNDHESSSSSSFDSSSYDDDSDTDSDSSSSDDSDNDSSSSFSLSSTRKRVLRKTETHSNASSTDDDETKREKQLLLLKEKTERRKRKQRKKNKKKMNNKSGTQQKKRIKSIKFEGLDDDDDENEHDEEENQADDDDELSLLSSTSPNSATPIVSPANITNNKNTILNSPLMKIKKELSSPLSSASGFSKKKSPKQQQKQKSPVSSSSPRTPPLGVDLITVTSPSKPDFDALSINEEKSISNTKSNAPSSQQQEEEAKKDESMSLSLTNHLDSLTSTLASASASASAEHEDPFANMKKFVATSPMETSTSILSNSSSRRKNQRQQHRRLSTASSAKSGGSNRSHHHRRNNGKKLQDTETVGNNNNNNNDDVPEIFLLRPFVVAEYLGYDPEQHRLNFRITPETRPRKTVEKFCSDVLENLHEGEEHAEQMFNRLATRFLKAHCCPRHKALNLSHYCYDCDIFVCESCVVEAHPTHDVIARSAYCTQKIANMQPIKEMFEKRIALLDSLRGQVDDAEKRLLASVDGALTQCRAALDNRRTELKNDATKRGQKMQETQDREFELNNMDMNKVLDAIDIVKNTQKRGILKTAPFVELHLPATIKNETDLLLPSRVVQQVVQSLDWSLTAKHLTQVVYPSLEEIAREEEKAKKNQMVPIASSDNNKKVKK